MREKLNLTQSGNIVFLLSGTDIWLLYNTVEWEVTKIKRVIASLIHQTYMAEAPEFGVIVYSITVISVYNNIQVWRG